MSTEVKKEGETKDNTQKKKELEDKIAKVSVKGTEESLKCFEELKRLNKTLNGIESVKDITKIYKTIFPKFDDHSFTKIRNAVMNEGKIKGGAEQEIQEFIQGETGLIFKSGGNYYVYLEIKKGDKGPMLDIISKSKLRVKKVIEKSELVTNDSVHEFMRGGAPTAAGVIANAIKDDAVAVAEVVGEAGMFLARPVTSPLKAAANKMETAAEAADQILKAPKTVLTDEQEALKNAKKRITSINIGVLRDLPGFTLKLEDIESALTKLKKTEKSIRAYTSTEAESIKKEIQKINKKLINLEVQLNGAFYEVVSVKNDLSSEMPIESVDLKTLQEKFTLKIKEPEEITREEAVQLLLEYQKAILDEYKNPTEEHLTKLYSIGNKIVEEIEKNPVLQNSDLHKNFVKNWKEKEKETAEKNPKILADTREKMSAFAVNLDQAIIDKTGVDIKNKKGALGLGTMGVGIGIAEALYPGVSSGVGQYLLAAISSHPVLATIVVAAVVAAKHFKPGEPDDYLTMYMGTELAPQLQIIERKRLTAKTGTTGDLGLTYTKFVTDVLVPKAKGYLTGPGLISLITGTKINEGVTVGDNFKKFEKELTLKGGSLNLDTLLGQTLDASIDSEISKYEAKRKQIEAQISQIDNADGKSKKQIDALEQQNNDIKGEIKAKKDEKEKFSKTLETIKEEITKVVIKYLNGEYGSKGGGPVDEKDKDEVIQTLTELFKSGEIAEKISENILNIIYSRVKISNEVIDELKNINTELEEVSPKELSKLEQVSKGTHPIIYAKFVKTFGSEKGDKMFSKVFSSTIKRTMSAEENLATLFDENRKADLERVLVDENSITRAKLQELCNSYKEELAKKAEKKKKAAEEKKAREDKLKGKKASQTSTTSQEEDIDVSGVTSSISGLATSAYDKLTGLTGMVKDEKDKMSKDTLTPDLKTPDLQLKEVKSERRSYKPGDHKPEDLTTITRKELDELRESEETLRKQLEMDRAIIRQYKQNIEHDISEHYKVLKMKEEQLLQKSDYVLREQQKIVAYYMGVLQNRESIILEQERLLEMKRKRELEEIEELRAKIQHKLIKELEKEKKMMVKHHSKQMRKQRSLLQEELKEYTGDNLYLTRLASNTKSDKGSLKKNRGMIIQKSFMNTFVY